ncbi:MAG: hypothetical protein H6739_29775 [Alphaproteobacteria bacterium]|nr:hypothetical protein [Alphaproteobacteria bacterium]
MNLRTPLVAATLAALVACTPSVEDAPDQAAATYCDRAVECNWIASSEAEDCLDNIEDVFQAAWPTDNCGVIVREDWKQCLDQIDTIDCDSALQGLELILPNEACGIQQVCDAE